MHSQPYKKLTLFIILSVCLAFFLSIGWLFTGYFAPRNDTLWANNLYRIKEVYAAVIKGPKIAVVAGSSGLYGVSTLRIQHHFKIPAVNLATHGGLRDYYLHKAKESLKPGDFVILAPEYMLYASDDLTSIVKSDYIINFDKSYLKELPFEEQSLILKTYVHPWNILMQEITYHREGNELAVKFKRVSQNLNINGDVLNNVGVKRQNIAPVKLPYKFYPEHCLVRRVLSFIKWCEKKNIVVVVSWPGTLLSGGTSDDHNMRYLNSLESYLSAQGVERLGEPEDFFVKPADLYDTAYHLNQSGVAKRTAKLINFLEKSPAFNGWKEKYPRPLK